MYKQVILVRSDINMSRGKLAAQVAHASLQAYINANKKIAKKWLEEGAKKIILKASLRKINDIKNKLDKTNIPYALIKDAGLTEIRAGTITALGIGPYDEEEIDKFTASIPLL